jgi:hypothetical protein
LVRLQQVGRINLRFVDRETGEGREEGATRPDVILRQMSTRPGQVGALLGRCQQWPLPRPVCPLQTAT